MKPNENMTWEELIEKVKDIGYLGSGVYVFNKKIEFESNGILRFYPDGDIILDHADLNTAGELFMRDVSFNKMYAIIKALTDKGE